MVTTRPPKTIVEPTALGPVANTDAKLLIYRLFQKGRVLAQDGLVASGTRAFPLRNRSWTNSQYSLTDSFDMVVGFFMA